MTNPQQFNLRWNNHTHNLTQAFVELYETGKMVDVTLSCEGRFIKAHKIVLGACSPYLHEIFERHESIPHPVIILGGLSFEDVRLIVEFMYKGEVKVTESGLETLLKSAESLQIKGLSNVKTSNDDPKPTSFVNGSASNEIHKSLKAKPNPSNDQRYFCTHPEVGVSPGTPAHLKRKRAKINKEISQSICNSVDVLCPGGDTSVKPVNEVISSSKNENLNDDDLPMTIKIDPPHIRDIDEEDQNGSPMELEISNKINRSDGVISESKESRVANKSSTINEISSFSGTGYEGLSEPKEKIPRPPNAFMIFANEFRRKLANQFPNESNKDISIRLGVMWKNLETKEDYYTASRLANEEHKKKYPNYYYSPKEARMRKRWKQQQQQNQSNEFIAQYNPVHLVKVFMNDESGEIRQKNTSSS